MKKLLTFITLLFTIAGAAQEQNSAFVSVANLYSDSLLTPSVNAEKHSSIVKNEFAGFHLSTLLKEQKPVKKILGYSANNKPIELFYFPGTSTRKALVIGGVHGSELSAVEVARQLMRQLSTSPRPLYSVIIIPALFPDNIAKAEACKRDRIARNVGRYSVGLSVDPNRQLPALGKPFYIDSTTDAYGREIEGENRLLLQLIQAYAPDRIVNLHAIKDHSRAGIYADPRTDCKGKALGYSTDSSLALVMAKFIDTNKGNAFGNKIKTFPTTLYYLDPKPSAIGEKQQRNLMGGSFPGKIRGVSLGSWASTAVCDDKTTYHRPAMRILTVEFPGYKKPTEYRSLDDKQWFQKNVDLYAAAIYHYFLQQFYTEENSAPQNNLAIK